LPNAYCLFPNRLLRNRRDDGLERLGLVRALGAPGVVERFLPIGAGAACHDAARRLDLGKAAKRFGIAAHQGQQLLEQLRIGDERRGRNR
jgi:hypothetical protein